MKIASAKLGTLRSTNHRWLALALLLSACRPEIVDSMSTGGGIGGEVAIDAGASESVEVLIDWSTTGKTMLSIWPALTRYEPPISFTATLLYSDGTEESMTSEGSALGFDRTFVCARSCRRRESVRLTFRSRGNRATTAAWSLNVVVQALKRDVKLSDVEVTIVDPDGGVTP